MDLCTQFVQLTVTKMPEISVVIPFKNYAKELKEAIQSVLIQTWHDFEIILVDNRSSPEARDIAEEAQNKDKRVRIVLEEVPGAASARNTGIRASKGIYVALLDSDDLMKPDRLESQRKALEENPASTLIGSYKEELSVDGSLVNPCDCPVVPSWAAILFRGSEKGRTNPFCEPQTSTFFFRRTDALRAGLFDLKYNPFNWCEDTDFALKLYLLGSIHIVPKVLVSMRLHSKEIAQKRERDLAAIRNLDLFYQTLLQLVEEGQIKASFRDLQRVRSRWLRESGLKFLRYHQGIKVGRSLVRRAFWEDPWNLQNIKAFLRSCVYVQALPKVLKFAQFQQGDITPYKDTTFVQNLFGVLPGIKGVQGK